MDQLERNSNILRKYIPAAAVDLVAHWIIDLDFKLKITKERSTKLGDYRSPVNGSNHQITINHNLNTYSFLVTLVHEIAHLTAWNKYRNSIAPHGLEWKAEFKRMMLPFLNEVIFPEDVLNALKRHMQNPAATECSDPNLTAVLRRYDKKDGNNKLVPLQSIPFNTVFRFNENRLFLKGEKIRTRFKCKDIVKGHLYLFNAMAQVEIFERNEAAQGG
ncbi:MAG: SprT-like domain-containing protein [Bacteroidia bacterium]